ncbi:MAG: hypothetical protein ACTSRI_06970 [Promethearchaeota archaeon]
MFLDDLKSAGIDVHDDYKDGLFLIDVYTENREIIKFSNGIGADLVKTYHF